MGLIGIVVAWVLKTIAFAIGVIILIAVLRGRPSAFAAFIMVALGATVIGLALWSTWAAGAIVAVAAIIMHRHNRRSRFQPSPKAR